MLKFFRKYNKYILVVGGSLLMVVFLIQGTISMWLPSGASTPIATIQNSSGEKITITVGDRRTASIELDVLKRLGLGTLPPLAQRSQGNEDIRYYLMVTAASRLGLSASQAEINQVLALVGADQAQVNTIATTYRAQPEFVYQSVRHWLMIQAYRNLALGHGFLDVKKTSASPGIQLLELYIASIQARQQKKYIAAQTMMARLIGTQRVSQPQVAHFLEDILSHATGKMMVINSDRLLDKVKKPGKKQLQQLFKKYKDDLPGQSKPYGFGYRIPNRVKLVYMVIPLEKVKKTVHIGEAEALKYYQSHSSQFEQTSTPSKSDDSKTKNKPSKPKIKPYIEVRQQIMNNLAAKKAQQLAMQMAKTAHNLLLEEVRPLSREGGYRQIPQDFKPAAFSDIAQQLQARFKIKPQVHTVKDHWVTAQKLGSLPTIGLSFIGSGSGRHSFSQYVLSARELNPSKDNALVARRLQVGVPSDILKSPMGPVIFRLIAAEPTREPKNLDEVRKQVTSDAKKLDAYKLLLTQKEDLLKQVAEKGMASVASSMNLSVEAFKNKARRVRRYGTLNVPFLPGVGQSKQVIDAIFRTANLAVQQQVKATPAKNSKNGKAENDKSFADIPREKRLGAARINDQLSLAVFQIDDFKLLTHKQFGLATENIALVALSANSALNRSMQKKPLSLESLQKHLGYVEVKTQRPQNSPQPNNPRPAPLGAG